MLSRALSEGYTEAVYAVCGPIDRSLRGHTVRLADDIEASCSLALRQPNGQLAIAVLRALSPAMGYPDHLDNITKQAVINMHIGAIRWIRSATRGDTEIVEYALGDARARAYHHLFWLQTPMSTDAPTPIVVSQCRIIMDVRLDHTVRGGALKRYLGTLGRLAHHEF
jgi:hypothetical protein